MHGSARRDATREASILVDHYAQVRALSVHLVHTGCQAWADQLGGRICPDQGDYLHHGGQYPELVTVRLRPMTASEISAFAQHQQGKYVADRVAAGETPAHAQEQADQQWERYFPAGGAADGHRLHHVVDGAEVVGQLWLGPSPDGKPGADWIYYIEVDEAVRGRGYGRAAMLLAEQDARQHGAVELGLNVFGPNKVARKLYESVGYEATAINMVKQLPPH
jgi:ribosomal protein S18 acetylase RimI-like enzyme